MLSWFKENIGTIVISVILSGVVALIVYKLFERKKQGKCISCNCCDSCNKYKK